MTAPTFSSHAAHHNLYQKSSFLIDWSEGEIRVEIQVRHVSFASKNYVLGADIKQHVSNIANMCEMTEMAALKGKKNFSWRSKDTCSIQNHWDEQRSIFFPSFPHIFISLNRWNGFMWYKRIFHLNGNDVLFFFKIAHTSSNHLSNTLPLTTSIQVFKVLKKRFGALRWRWKQITSEKINSRAH